MKLASILELLRKVGVWFKLNLILRVSFHFLEKSDVIYHNI